MALLTCSLSRVSFSSSTVLTASCGMTTCEAMMRDSLERYPFTSSLIPVARIKSSNSFIGSFPVHNLSGKIIAFGARILTKEKNQPKYINSPETAVYHKSNILYGISQAKLPIKNHDNCFLVEGYTDVLSLAQGGIENVVASSGTSLTVEQIKLINRYTEGWIDT